MEYKSKFKAAEIDARLEKMVNVTYAELVALRDEGKLIAGQMYRMTDYETTCTWENTQVAGHLFDLVLTALDNKTLDEKCSAIWSERDTDGYFANSNLAAWDVRYCLDNDKGRFDWAQLGGTTLTISAFGMRFNSRPFGICDINGVAYNAWEALNNGSPAFLILSQNPKPTIGDSVHISFSGKELEETAIVDNVYVMEDGKGVIYRLIDESENSAPYDFKNIMFMRPLTEGKYDAENGVDTFCYTFSCIQEDLTIEDQSVKEPFYCSNNRFASYCTDNVFLTFSESSCYSNTFGESCYSNTFGSDVYCNSLVNGFSENSFGDDFYNNVFGKNCYGNVAGNSFNENVVGDNFIENTIGKNFRNNKVESHCVGNIFGRDCLYVTLGINCRNNNFVDYMKYVTIDNGCSDISFANNEQGSTAYMVKNYHIHSVSNAIIDVYRNRTYQNNVTTKKDGTVVEYTVDDILNGQSNTPS